MTHPAGYRALADLIRGQIESGELVAGQRLPSVDGLAQMYGLNRLTVLRAFTVLRNEGLITVRHGYATRVRETGDTEDVDVPPTRVTARMPSPADRERWGGIPEGCPMLVALDVLDEQGRPMAWPADRFRLKPG